MPHAPAIDCLLQTFMPTTLPKLIAVLCITSAPQIFAAQLPPSATWAAQAANNYTVVPNITYLVANNYEAKLDVYKRRNATGPQPTLIFIHGGGWVGGSKEGSMMSLMPWLEMGWNVVNVEYRLDRECPGLSLPKVAAIVNWYGITDVCDLMDGPNRKSYAVAWLASMPNRDEIARRVSPLTYIRSGLPPILTIHGDADPTVPYTHAVRLHEALAKADVPNQLLTIPGGKHGGFTPEERLHIFAVIREFLAKHGFSGPS